MPAVLLLTEPECVPSLRPRLEAEGAIVAVAVSKQDLLQATADLTPDTRLVSFASSVIVPAATLARLSGPAYNFHPGPPEYPGLFPSVHALYDGCAEFAVTIHEMAPRVDSGAIISVERFQIPPDADRLTLDSVTFRMMIEAFSRWAARLANVATPLARQRLTWTGAYRSRADFEALCDLGENPTAEEFNRRLRAVGEGPNHALSFTRFGRRFRLMSESTPVVRGGLKVG